MELLRNILHGLSAEHESADLIAGRYRLICRLGEGAGGVVYRARDEVLDRIVALKIFHEDADPRASQRANREARTLAALHDPNVVRIFAYGSQGAVFWIAMEHVAGRSLACLLDDLAVAATVLPFRRALDIVRQVAGALSAIHSVGLVHLDVKPGNVIVDERSSRVVRVDFGLARRRSRQAADASLIGGTPSYMAPEQARCDSLCTMTPAADLYALACVAFELFTGTTPFDGATLYEVLDAHQHHAAPLPSSRLPALAPLDPVFDRAMAKSPKSRQADCAAFFEEVATAAAAIPRHTIPTTPVVRVERAPLMRIVIVADDAVASALVTIASTTLAATGDTGDIDCVARLDLSALHVAIERRPPDLVIVDAKGIGPLRDQIVAAVERSAGAGDAEIFVIDDDGSRPSGTRRIGGERDVRELARPISAHVLRAAIGQVASRRRASATASGRS